MASVNLWLAIAVLRGMESERPSSERLVRDPVSLRLLPPAWRVLIRLLSGTGLSAAVMARRERQFPGVIGSLLCRTRYIDDALAEALEAGAQQVVILGAGFDTRAYRIPGIESAAVFEVDHPAAQAAKRKALGRARIVIPPGTAFVAVDLEHDDVAAALAGASFRPGTRTFFICEGVTQYISRRSAEDTLAFVGAAGGRGSELAFTYIRAGVIDGGEATDAERRVIAQAAKGGAAWRTGFDPGEVPELLARCGLRLVEDVGGAECRERYLEPAGRRLSTLAAERIVLATTAE